MTARTKIRVSLLLALALIAAVKLILPAPKKPKASTDAFWVDKTFSDKRNNVVVAGDSRAYRGVAIASLEEALGQGLTATNLGYSAAGFSPDYLDHAVSRLDDSGPRILVLGITPHSLTSVAFANEHFQSFRHKGQFEVFTNKYLSDVLRQFDPYSPVELISSKKRKQYDVYHASGWVASTEPPVDSARALLKYRKIFSEYQSDPNLADSLIRELTRIQASGVHVITFRPPTTQRMRQLEDALSGFDEAAFMRQLQTAGIPYWQYSNADYTSFDGSHLHAASAEKLGATLGAAIRELLLSRARKEAN
ncbi:MAG: hypothetical protein AAGB22_06380 [Bacteroidota bacterium]